MSVFSGPGSPVTAPGGLTEVLPTDTAFTFAAATRAQS